jgi:hypothetical protein
VKDLLRKVIGWLRGKQSGLVLLELRGSHLDPQARRTATIPPPIMVEGVRTFIWTPEEAEAAWRAGRTKYNFGETFRRFAKSLSWMAGGVLIDNEAARAVVCADHEVQKRLLSTPTSTTRAAFLSIQAKEREKVQRDQAAKDQAAKEEQWMRNGCHKDSFGNWTVPDELMWRSLPRGEDR